MYMKTEERIACLSAALRYRVLSGDSFERPIVFLPLLLAVALVKRPVWRRVPQLNYLSYPYTLTNHILATTAGVCIVRVIRDRQQLVTCPSLFCLVAIMQNRFTENILWKIDLHQLKLIFYYTICKDMLHTSHIKFAKRSVARMDKSVLSLDTNSLIA